MYSVPMTKSSTERDLLHPDEVSGMLGVAPSTLVTWRKRKQGPPYIRLGYRTVRYARVDVEAWLAANQEGM